MKKVRISKFMKIFITLIFLLILETVIIFMLIGKSRINNIHKDVPGYNRKIPLTVVINYSVKNESVDTT